MRPPIENDVKSSPAAAGEGHERAREAGLWLDARRHIFVHDGTEWHLEPRAFSLLAYLLTHAEGAVSKEELLQEVWAGRYVTENVIARCVMKLRKTLAAVPRPCATIATVHRIGYRLRWLDTTAGLRSRRVAAPHDDGAVWGDF